MFPWNDNYGYINTDMVWAATVKKAIENIDSVSLKRILNTTYGFSAIQADPITVSVICQELQRRNKEEKKMEDKKYYSGSVAVTTWRSRKTFGDLDDQTDYVVRRLLNHRTDIITFKDGVFINVTLETKTGIPYIDTKKRFTKEEISELITTAWDKGAYADDQTDISWIFNPDPEGFTGTVDLATVLLKDRYGYRGSFDAYHNPLVRARCRVRIVDGTFFEKLDGSSNLADILKQHKGVFSTKEDIEKYIKDKWLARDFGNDTSYYVLEIEEE